MSTVALRLTGNLHHQLERIAKQLHRTKSFIVRKALETYMRDYVDYQIALDRLNDKDDAILSSKEMRASLGK